MANQDKMPCKYETFKDLSDRLDGSIVLYRDFPYFVSVKMADDGVKGRILLSRLDSFKTKDGKVIEVKVDDPDLDISATDLGYVNYVDRQGNHQVLYTYRTTAKHFKQALYPSYIATKNIEGVDYGASNLWMTRGAFDLLIDYYPTLSEALSLLDTRYKVAISRDVALHKRKSGIILIYLRCKEVAWVDPINNNLVFSEKATWVDRHYVLRFPWRYHAKYD